MIASKTNLLLFQMGLAIVAMSINLVQEEIVEKIREFAKDIGLIDDHDDDSVKECANTGWDSVWTNKNLVEQKCQPMEKVV